MVHCDSNQKSSHQITVALAIIIVFSTLIQEGLQERHASEFSWEPTLVCTVVDVGLACITPLFGPLSML